MSTILDISQSFKDAGARKYGEPPYGPAELSSLKMFAQRTGLDRVIFPGIGKLSRKELCTRFNLDTEKIITGLGAKQTKAEPAQTIREIAQARGMEPQDPV